MTDNEYRDAIADLGLSQSGACDLLGCNVRSHRDWMSGERDTPKPVIRFLHFLIAAEIDPGFVIDTLNECYGE